MREFTTRKYQRRKKMSLTLAWRKINARPCGGQAPVRSERRGRHAQGATKQNERGGAHLQRHSETKLADWDEQGHVELASCARKRTQNS